MLQLSVAKLTKFLNLAMHFRLRDVQYASYLTLSHEWKKSCHFAKTILLCYTMHKLYVGAVLKMLDQCLAVREHVVTVLVADFVFFTVGFLGSHLSKKHVLHPFGFFKLSVRSCDYSLLKVLPYVRSELPWSWSVVVYQISTFKIAYTLELV